MDIIFELAENIARTQFDNLPYEVVDVTKKFVLDTIGNAIAGSAASGSSELVSQVKSWGGTEESTVLTFGGRLPSIHAAFVNSYMTFARDFGDTHMAGRSGVHCNDTVLPASLAIAEQEKKSGKDFITALALGIDLEARLGMSVDFFRGWHTTSILGGFGAAASAGKLLGLDKERLVDALGIAYSQTHGNRQGRQDGAASRRLQVAFASKAGTYSALLARAGFTGARNILEGQWGFYRLYRDPAVPFDNETSKKILCDELGKRFEIVNLAVKPYPSCGGTHGPIDAALQLAAKERLEPSNVETVTVHVSTTVKEIVGAPFAIRVNPQLDAQFSIPYTVAVALVKGKVTLKDFEPGEIRGNARVLEMAAKIRVEVDEKIQYFKGKGTLARVEVLTKDGKKYSNEIEVVKGYPQNPMGFDEVAEKFRQSVEYSAKALRREQLETLIGLIAELERVRDVCELTALVQ
ncbi:MAG TPA: MmgE/PrpD family protein [Syntrophorhabdaceae bacterium]|nr:MmgE/PrpD family protein [Syntrophorhabdaceae bacterium]